MLLVLFFEICVMMFICVAIFDAICRSPFGRFFSPDLVPPKKILGNLYSQTSRNFKVRGGCPWKNTFTVSGVATEEKSGARLSRNCVVVPLVPGWVCPMRGFSIQCISGRSAPRIIAKYPDRIPVICQGLRCWLMSTCYRCFPTLLLYRICLHSLVCLVV